MLGCAATNCSTFVGLGASGGLAAMARNRSRKSAPFETGKNFSALMTRSLSLPSGRWNLIAMPCGLASGMPSGIFGMPVASEKRAVSGISLPLKSTALLSAAASGVALKLPSTTMPFAWLARKPLCTPNTLFMASTICSAIGFSSAAAAPDHMRQDAIIAATVLLFAIGRLTAFVCDSLRQVTAEARQKVPWQQSPCIFFSHHLTRRGLHPLLKSPVGRMAAAREARCGPQGRSAILSGGKSGLHGNTAPDNVRRGRPQGKCHRKQTALLLAYRALRCLRPKGSGY